MAEATLSARNRIVIPREIRDALQLEAGDKLTVHIHGNILVLGKSNPAKSGRKRSSKESKQNRTGRST
jgi:AbrB family looped-hinge helix DNA binding protein